MRTRIAVCAVSAALLLVALAPASTAGGGVGWGGRSGSAPGWSTSMRVSVRDGGGRPVFFWVFFQDGSEHFGGHAYHSCGKSFSMPVPKRGASFFVEVRAGADTKCPDMVSMPMGGVITITYLGRKGRKETQRFTYDSPHGIGTG